MKPEIAESVAQVISASRKSDFSQLASKVDLIEVDSKIEKHTSDSENRLDNKITAVQTELLKTENRLDSKISDVASRLEAKISGVESRLDAKISEVESKLEAKISGVESRLDAKIGAVDSRLAIEIEKSKNEILKWVVGMNIATISILMAFFKLFVR
ncbi:MAG: hypothetical protein K0R73_821 [Candidatus Midichloriaceae bacterium]|nr:hypothetical protein [Candidatus Midichloriaceae bacterium]